MLSRDLQTLLMITVLLPVLSCTSVKKVNPQQDVTKPTLQKIRKNEAILLNPSPKKIIAPEEGAFDDDRFQLKTNLAKWKLIDEEHGIRTFERKVNGNGLVAFRGEVTIPSSLKKIATILVHQPHQKDWVHAYVNGYNVSEISDTEYIQYSETKVPWPFQNRDFVFRAKASLDRDPNTMLIWMKSEPHPSTPPIEGIVRGEILHSYYYLKELDSGKNTRLVVEMEVDPKGEIPLWLVNLSQRGWPMNTLSGIRKMALKKNLKILPKLENYFEPKSTLGEKKK
jgi:hypothetical protein